MPTIPTLPKQIGFLGELGYYNKDANLSVFGKFEMKSVSDFDAQNQMWFGAGLKYFIATNNMNFTLAWNRTTFPNKTLTPTDNRSDANQFTLQAQFFYY
jgi:hypothetical protein